MIKLTWLLELLLYGFFNMIITWVRYNSSEVTWGTAGIMVTDRQIRS